MSSGGVRGGKDAVEDEEIDTIRLMGALQFQCDGCGRVDPRPVQFEGETVRCECGAVIEARPVEEEGPEGAPGPIPETMPEAIPEAVPMEAIAVPAQQPTAAPAAAVPLSYQRPRMARPGVEVEDLNFPDRMRDLYAPIMLLGLAMVLLIGEAMYLNLSLGRASAWFVSYLVVKGLILLIAIPVLIWTTGLALGTLPSAMLKFAAIATLPEALFLLLIILLTPCIGIIMAIPACFVLSIMMFGRLFELEIHEAILCVVATWGLAIALNLLWAWVMNLLLGLAG